MQKLQSVRGTHDIFPDEARKRRHLSQLFFALAECYGYGEMSPPVFEFSDVFHRTLGDTSDVVSKETYTFTDRGGESLTLRPEFTAGVVRAFIQEGRLLNELPVKFAYLGPAFRYERPQKGRLRQFHQLGAEVLGAPEPEADVEVISLAWRLLSQLNLAPHVTLEFNSLGDAESRTHFRDKLVAYFTPLRSKLSSDSQTRLDKNPLRILDSKDEGDRALMANAPAYADSMSQAARDFQSRVQDGLATLGITSHLNPRLVRGLDYYSHTVFEFTTDRLGAQGTVLAGGRYDGLVKLMGGTDVPGIGFAAGIERLLSLMEEMGYAFPASTPPVAVVPMDEQALTSAQTLAEELRATGVRVEMAYKGNAKKRMQRADKAGASIALLLGESELTQNSVTLKNLATGEQKTVARSQILAETKALFVN